MKPAVLGGSCCAGLHRDGVTNEDGRMKRSGRTCTNRRGGLQVPSSIRSGLRTSILYTIRPKDFRPVYMQARNRKSVRTTDLDHTELGTKLRSKHRQHRPKGPCHAAARLPGLRATEFISCSSAPSRAQLLLLLTNFVPSNACRHSALPERACRCRAALVE
jgi:hypothetical protein